ncbi:MAG: hypothetical protein AAGJ28_02880 [Pseudomonadota bacterium]
MPEHVSTIGDVWTLLPAVSPSYVTLQARPRAIAGGGVPAANCWTQDPVNAASVFFNPDSMVLTPASTSFLDRAQVYHSIASVPGAAYTVDIDVDVVPTSGLSMLIFNVLPTPTLFSSSPILSTGVTRIEFVAQGTATRIFLRVDGTTDLARIRSVTIDAEPGDSALHFDNYPHQPGRLFIGRSTDSAAPTDPGFAIIDTSIAPTPFTLSDLSPGGSGTRLWGRWEGPTVADLWMSWAER